MLQRPEVSNSTNEPSSSSIFLGSGNCFEPPKFKDFFPLGLVGLNISGVSVSLACISHVPSWVVYTYLVYKLVSPIFPLCPAE